MHPRSTAFLATTIRLALSSLLLFTGVSRAQQPNLDATLQSGALSLAVETRDHRIAGLSLHDAITGRTIRMDEAFVLVFKDQSRLLSSEMTLTPIADPTAVPDPHRSLRGVSAKEPAKEKSCWNFTAKNTAAAVQWCVVAGAHSGYIRELLGITAKGADLPIAEVRMLDFPDAAAKVSGSVKGSPIVEGQMFFAVEHPLSISAVVDGKARSSILRELPLRAGQTITYSAVMGTSDPGQLRRAFLAYMEAERPRPYEPFLHYNSWFDLGYGNRFDQAGVLDRINSFGQELSVKRQVKLDSFLLDDGWDDPHTLWGLNPGFPDGLTKADAAASRYGAGIGMWLSPWGGYDEEKKQRIAYGRAHGFEIQNGGYALSGPKYFERFEATCLDLVKKYNVNQFKFDGTGNADKVFPGSAFDSDFDAAIQLIERLRKAKPDLFINLTTGTTASPFWLFYADSIWRGGDDHSFSGEGTARQRWMTYRDAQTYKNIVLRGPLFPLNSLMLHGIIYASQAKDLGNDPGNDFADEIHSYFGSGTQLQEMYITPALLSTANWDDLAAAARWSRSHSDTLKDTHWIGGDPDRLQIYGWAAWSPRMGIVTLRNPSKAAQRFALEPRQAFDLRKDDPAAYVLHTVWDSAGAPKRAGLARLQKGAPTTIELAPFEVITWEATPVRSSGDAQNRQAKRRS